MPMYTTNPKDIEKQFDYNFSGGLSYFFKSINHYAHYLRFLKSSRDKSGSPNG